MLGKGNRPRDLVSLTFISNLLQSCTQGTENIFIINQIDRCETNLSCCHYLGLNCKENNFILWTFSEIWLWYRNFRRNLHAIGESPKLLQFNELGADRKRKQEWQLDCLQFFHLRFLLTLKQAQRWLDRVVQGQFSGQTFWHFQNHFSFNKQFKLVR